MTTRQLCRTRWFLRELWQRAVAGRSTQLASALAYTSILALVPVLVVGFATLSLFPAFAAWQSVLQDFIFQSFVPGVGDRVESYLTDFAAKARDLQGLGVAALLVTVLSLMSSIEAAFNDIWEVRRRRPIGKRLLLYWTILTLGPLLIGAGLVATSFLVSLPLLHQAAALTGLNRLLLHWLPLITTWLAFVLSYKAIPHHPVRLRHALAGGLFAALLFEITKRLFASWLLYFPTQQAIYGAFATVPVFLLWIFVSWFIVLLGAQFTRCLEVVPAHCADESRSPWRHAPCYRAWRILVHLYRAQRSGVAISQEALLAQEPGFDARELADSLKVLADAHWISRDEMFCWLLVRDLDELSLLDLARLVPPSLRVAEAAQNLPPEDGRFRHLLEQHRQGVERDFSCSLAALMQGAEGAAARVDPA